MARCLKDLVPDPIFILIDFQKAIRKGFGEVFKETQISHCFNHLRQCIKRFVDSNPDLKKERNDWVDMIVGCKSRNTSGFLNLPVEKYKEEIANLPSKLRGYWNKHLGPLVEETMLKERREALGITEKLTTNLAESAHAAEKAILGKELELHIFAEKCVKLMESNYKDWQRCLTKTNSRYRLSSLGKNLYSVPEESNHLARLHLYSFQAKEVSFFSLQLNRSSKQKKKQHKKETKKRTKPSN